MTRTELLSPARDLECGFAAVDCGADAVYVGGPSFSARRAAAMSIRDIEKLCLKAHTYFCRVYLAVNTLLHDREIPLAARLCREAADAGVDALIVQDMGLVEAGLPRLPLIASTQCHNDSPEKILFLEKAGFSRVILGRELSLPEISRIRSATTVELEAFVHGALCWSWSGRCWLSHSLGGRSGNRGECGQPCRLPWTLVDADGRVLADRRHLLSLRDLNLSAGLSGLLETGVTSFKIEGRLKGPDYVKNVTTYYRQKLDALLDGKSFSRSSSGTSVPGFAPDPDKTFNRGYTPGPVSAGPSSFSMDTPKMKGALIGLAAGIRGSSFELIALPATRPGLDRRLQSPDRDNRESCPEENFSAGSDASRPAHPCDGGRDGSGVSGGDGICWFDPEGSLSGSTVIGVSGSRYTVRDASGLREGSAIYRNLDSVFEAELGKARPRRTIRVGWEVKRTDTGLLVVARDEDGIEVERMVPGAAAPRAENADKVRSAWQAAFARLGETVFESGGVSFGVEEIPFVPVSALNHLRRTIVEDLTRSRERSRPRPLLPPVDPSWPYPASDIDFEAGVLNASADRFYRRHGVERVEYAPESGLDMGGRRIARSLACPLKILGFCGKKGVYFIRDDKGRKLELRPDCGKCEISVYTTSSGSLKK